MCRIHCSGCPEPGALDVLLDIRARKQLGATLQFFLRPCAHLRAVGPPAPGSRHPYDGKLSGVGFSGYNWMATASGLGAKYLNFYFNEIYPNVSHYRSNGLQLRCLQE